MKGRFIPAQRDTPPDIVTFVKDRWEEQQTHINARKEDWYNNIAFYLGYQWQSWSNAYLAYFSPPHEDVNGLYMIVGNLIKPLVQTRMSKYVNNRPQIIVTACNEDPLSGEQADKETSILNALWKQMNMRTNLVDIAKWMVVTNQCFVRMKWDKNYGEEKENTAYINEEETPDQNPTFKTGRMDLDLLNGYQVIMDNTKKSFRAVRERGWISIKSVQTKEGLLRALPDKANVIDKLKPEHVATIGDIQDRVLNLQDRGSVVSRKDDKDKYDQYQTVTVYEYYHAPTKKDPDGIYAIICQDKVLYDGVLPNKLKKIPIIMFQDQRGFDTLWGRSLVSHSRQMQKIYNLLLSKIFSYSMLPVIYGFPRNSGVDLETLPDDGYVICEYDREEGEPIIVNPAPLPEAWMFLLNYIQGMLEHNWGTHEVSMRGSTPGNTRLSGRGIYLLQEGDQARHGPWYMTWEDSLEDMGELILEIAKDKFDETRAMTYTGEDGRSYPIEFNKGDITGKGKVQVEVGSEFMRNKQGMQKFFTDIMQAMPNLPELAKTLNDPVGLHNLMSMLDEGLANRLVYRNKHVQTAERENRAFLTNFEIKPVEEWHKHIHHLQQHIRFMNSPEYDKLPDQMKTMWWERHVKVHGLMMQNAMGGGGQNGPDGKPI